MERQKKCNRVGQLHRYHIKNVLFLHNTNSEQSFARLGWGTNEAQVQVHCREHSLCVYRWKMGSFSSRQLQQAETRKSPGRIVLASLSPSASYPHAQRTIRQKLGFKNHGAHCVFFVNAIACKKRFSSPIFSVSARRLLCNTFALQETQ